MAHIARFASNSSGILLGALLALAGCTPKDTSGPANAQGWTPGNQRFWWETSQGSRIMPASWWAALEQPGGTAAFSDQTYIARFGYLPSSADRLSARGENLPIGFAVDRQPDDDFRHTKLRWYKDQPGGKAAEPWVGLNCSACHSGLITYKGEKMLIDGAPGMGDFQSFVNAIDAALTETATQQPKFDRFAAKVLGAGNNADNQKLLRQSLDQLIAWEDKAAKVNGDRPGGVLRYGYARVDAFGHIYNKTALFNGADPQPGNPADAPVSYPFLWDIWRQGRVQWNGAVSNQRAGSFDYGAMGRNAGEVIGVFGEVVVPKWGEKPNTGKIWRYKSSLRIKALQGLEEVLTTLKPPTWPAAFPPIDEALKTKGEAVFDRLKCGDCHTERENWVKDKPIEVMTPLKDMGPNLTDIWMACNAVTYATATGNMEGGKINIIKGPELGGKELVFNQLQFTVKTALIGKSEDLIKLLAGILVGIDAPTTIEAQQDGETFEEAKLRRGRSCVSGQDIPPAVMKYLAYKGRPLDGIWATAPYLHNGSVPTLYHLLLAPKDRPARFFIGSHDYDPAKVGYVWETPPAEPHSMFETVDTSGKAILGNSNGGHDYGVSGLSEPDRLALLEYLKSL
jgi:hypothetical protein